jgi:hypothetical protein
MITLKKNLNILCFEIINDNHILIITPLEINFNIIVKEIFILFYYSVWLA